jgi:hypothetical protein
VHQRKASQKINKWKTQKKSNCTTEGHCSFDLPPCVNPLLPLYCFLLFWISSILPLASHATCFSIAYGHCPILLVPLLPYLAITTAPTMLSMWSCKLKLDEEKSKHAYLFSKMVLAQHFSIICWGWWKLQQSKTSGKEECNEYDLAVDPCFWSVTHNDWSKRVASSHLPPIFAIPVFVLWGGWKNVDN